MNILLLYNKKNLLGIKLVIYSLLYCNYGATIYIGLTEEITEKEKINIQNLVTYADSLSTVVFITIDPKIPLEKQFDYMDNLLYIAADCIVTQTITDIYQSLEDDVYDIIINKAAEEINQYCVVFLNLQHIRDNNKTILITYNDDGLNQIICENGDIDYFDPRIGFYGTFSFNFNMPIIFWFINENDKIYKIDIKKWKEKYEDFAPLVNSILLAETIYF